LQSIRSSPKNFNLELLNEEQANAGVSMIYRDNQDDI